MSYEEEFDKIVRQKAGEAEYPFDESNWAKTSRMLDAQRAAARKGFWKKFFVPGAVIITASIAGIVAYSQLSTDANNTGTKQVSVNTITVPAKEVQPTVENTGYITVNSEKGSSPLKQRTEEATVNSKAVNSQNAAPITSTENNKIASANNTKAVEPTSDGQTNVTTAAAKTPGSEKNINPSNDPVLNTHDVAKGTSKTENNSNTPVNKSSEGAINPENNNNNNNNSNSFAQSGDNKSESTPVTPVTSDNATMGSDITNSEISTADLLQSLSINYPVQFTEGSLVSTSLTIVNSYNDDYVKKPKTHFVDLEAGGNYLLGWNTAKGTDGKGLNWFGGINYRYQLCDKTSFGLGFQAYNITNINSPFYTTIKKEYGFGSTNTYTEITAKELYYIAIPVRMNYHLNSANMFGIGLNAGYLITAKNETKTYVATDGQGAPTRSNEIFENVRSTNIMGSIYYNVKFTQRLALNAEFVYGFNDLFLNTATIKNAEKPVGLRLSLQYCLFSK